MDSMYDKLGDLLKETLDTGKVKFVHVEKNEFSESEKSNSQTQNSSESQQKTFSEKINSTGTNKTTAPEKKQKSFSPEKVLEKKQLLLLSETEKRAVKLLGLCLPFTQENLKSAYKEKIKYFHPDHWNNNKVLTDIANKKTAEIMEANKLLTDFLSRNNFN